MRQNKVLSDDEIKDQLSRLLGNRTIADERRVAELIVDAITFKHVDTFVVEQAVRQTVQNYETKLRVFAVAAANNQLKRILNLIKVVDDLETELGNPVRYTNMESKDLIKLYAVAQANLTTALDYIKKVIDMRTELQEAQKAMDGESELKNVDAKYLPSLTAQQRDHVRRLIEGISRDVIETRVEIINNEQADESECIPLSKEVVDD